VAAANPSPPGRPSISRWDELPAVIPPALVDELVETLMNAGCSYGAAALRAGERDRDRLAQRLELDAVVRDGRR